MNRPAFRPRTRLGGRSSLGDRQRVWLTDDAIEVDLLGGYEIETRRVFLTDVEYLTCHFRRSRLLMWLVGVSTALGVLIWLATIAGGSGGREVVWVTFLFIVAPNLPFLLVFVRPHAVVTVFGKRSKASMQWFFRHGRARRVFAQLAALVSEHQERERARAAQHQEPVVPASALPLPPDAAPSPPVA